MNGAGAGPTTVFGGGRILSMDARVGEPEVLVVQGGQILDAGPAALRQQYPDAASVDLGGDWLVPGFIDAHHHLCIAALTPLWADLTGVTDLDEVGRRLRDVADREPDAPWVRACQWDDFATGLRFDRTDLDAFGIDRPVIVACFSVHRAVVSTAGLDALGIGRDTPEPRNGLIERDTRGEATGLLVEGAWSEAHARSLAGYDDPDRWADLIEARARALLGYGITAVNDAACPPAAEQVYRDLARAGRLPVSVVVMPHATELLTGPDPARWDGPRTGEGDEQVRVGAVKFFADGGVEPAIDAYAGGYHVQTGRLFAGLDAGVETAVARGYGVAIHAMGNIGLAAALDAWEQATRRRAPDHFLRIEHVTLAGEAEVERMGALGAMGIVQPAFVELLGKRLQGARFDDVTWMPFGDLFARDVSLAASSDAPCTFAEPLPATAFGVSRRTSGGHDVDPRQSIGFEEWLRLYTAGAAAAGGQAEERGRLAPGLRADLVAIAGAPGDDGVEVSRTWRGGQLVYEGRAVGGAPRRGG